MTGHRAIEPTPQVLTAADADKSCFKKRTFMAKNTARDSAAKIKKHGGPELTPYRCMVCHRWHLTTITADLFPMVKGAQRRRAGRQ